MSNNNNRQNRPARQVRGPQSALTSYLQSQDISAAQIQADADARRAAARAAAAAANANGAADPQTTGQAGEDDVKDEAGPSSSTAGLSRLQQKRQKQQALAIANINKRQKQQALAIAKIKKSKAYKKRKREASDSESDDLAMALFNERSAPLPGQMANCEVCDKRFTVTPYTRAGPNGGLLCNPCGKELAQEDDMSKNKPKKRKIAQGRRGVQSRLLDGISQTGAKSLMTLCTETLAKNIELADSLGTMPPGLIDRIARLLSKRRLLGPKTLPLFLQPDNDVFKVYDGAYLGSDHFINIFQTIPRLKSLKIRNAIQFKDHVLQYLTNRHITLESLSLHGANLLSESCWEEYLQAKGKHLRSLQVYYTDKHFGDGLVGKLSDYCPSLARLKICHNQAVSDEGLKSMVQLQSLEHLSLHLRKPTQTDSYIEIIQTIGSQLQTFSLRDVPDIDDRLLDALHEHCASLTKLRITGSEVLTDAGIARLFRGWKTKPLTFIDLQECRHVDSAKPRENPHHVGLCSQGFKALMEHSGKRLQYLNVYSCRNISQEAFEEVFSADQVYPDLEKIELSFCEEVTDYICGCIFRCCPNLKELQVHGCMKVKEVRVPRGKILVGVPNALGMLIEGDD